MAKRTEQYDCQRCGVSVMRVVARGQRPKWCLACREVARFERTSNCAYCGATYTGFGERYCSRQCVGGASRKPKPVKVKQPKLPKPTPPPLTRFVSASCNWCGASFIYDLHRTGGIVSYCSRRCVKRAGKTRRRAREVSAIGSFTWSEVIKLYLALEGCAYCGLKCGTSDLEPDHVVPLSKGGSNSITNVVPACRWCNGDKRDLLLEDWYTDRADRGLPPRRLDSRVRHLTSV
jgi:5-methylcytosine-specific restriction endonuclease McrA